MRSTISGFDYVKAMVGCALWGLMIMMLVVGAGRYVDTLPDRAPGADNVIGAHYAMVDSVNNFSGEEK